MSGAKRVILREPELVHQIRNVLRMTVGGQLILLDGSGNEYMAFIVEAGYNAITCEILSASKSRTAPRRELTLIFSLIKKDNMEWVLQKGTELGVSRFLPFVSDRSEKKGFKRERALAIVREAAEQAGRAEIPIVREPIDFENVFAESKGMKLMLLHPAGEDISSAHIKGEGPVGLIIGPEGGFTEREVSVSKIKEVEVLSISPSVLRAETASIAGAALFLLSPID